MSFGVVTASGQHYHPVIVAQAIATPRSATGVVGSWADGLITVNQPVSVLERVVGAFREGGGGDKPVYVQVHLSWAEDENTALAIAHDQWRSSVFPSSLAWNLAFPEQFDAVAAHVRPDDVCEPVIVSADLDEDLGARFLAVLPELC